MNQRTPNPIARRGSALVMVMIVAVMLFGLASSLTMMTQSRQEIRQFEAENLIAIYSAESAAYEALDYLRDHPSDLELMRYYGDVMDIDLIDSNGNLAAVSAEVEFIGPETWVVTGYGDLHTGTPDRRSRMVQLLVTQPVTEVTISGIDQAMFADDSYNIQGAFSSDSWHSGGGLVPYSTAVAGNQGDVASNGWLSVNRSTSRNIQGDVISNANVELPQFEYDLPASYTELGAVTSRTNLNAAGNYHATSVSSAGQLVLRADGEYFLWIDGPYLAANPVVYRTSDSSLIIFQDDYSDSMPSTNINGNDSLGSINSPQRFIFMSLYSGEMTLNGNGQFGGVYLAPHATLKLNGTFDFFGSMGAATMARNKVNGTFNFHYDEALADVDITFTTVVPGNLIVEGWYGGPAAVR